MIKNENMSCKPITPKHNACKPSHTDCDKLNTIEKIITHYKNHQKNCCSLKMHWKYYRSLEYNEAIIKAGKFIIGCPDNINKKHSHQWRITKEASKELTNNLKQQSFTIDLSFNELFGQIDKIGKSIYGIGELTVYDTALRIGACLNLKPDKVYLHAGAIR